MTENKHILIRSHFLIPGIITFCLMMLLYRIDQFVYIVLSSIAWLFLFTVGFRLDTSANYKVIIYGVTTGAVVSNIVYSLL